MVAGVFGPSMKPMPMAPKRRRSRTTRATAKMVGASAIHDGEDVASILSVVGEKWSAIVLVKLRDVPKRFSRLSREVDGISPRALTLALRKLEQKGLVIRRMFVTIPPRVEYELTDGGRDLWRGKL